MISLFMWIKKALQYEISIIVCYKKKNKIIIENNLDDKSFEQ